MFLECVCVCVCVCVCFDIEVLYIFNCSGHGLSGLALLSLASYVAVPAMFAGGISLAGTIKLFSSIS